MNMKVYDMTHADKVIVEHPICPPLLARMGTGGNQVPLVLSQNQVGEIRCSETVAPTLTGQANASARNHPLVLMDQGGGVMSVEHDKVGTLRAQTHGHEPLVLDPYNFKEDDKCFTLRAGISQPTNTPMTVQEAYRISSDASGGALPHVFKLRSGCNGGGKGYLGQDDKSFTLATNNDQYLMTAETYCLAENTIGRQPHNGGNGNGWQKDLSYTLNATGVHGVKTEARVRKLTPIECERLQGFSDDYTKIPWKGKSAEECPDSPRYKAIGNSWCVPCVRWIGQRIQAELEKNK